MIEKCIMQELKCAIRGSRFFENASRSDEMN